MVFGGLNDKGISDTLRPYWPDAFGQIGQRRDKFMCPISTFVFLVLPYPQQHTKTTEY